ncbi:MAG: hypothetical protein Q7S28_03775, partial [bacterium]|nr:hypothetical protein [bacterium]
MYIKDIAPIKARQRFLSLPINLQTAFFSESTAKVIGSIEKKYSLSEEQVETLGGIIAYVFLGFVHKNDVPKACTLDLNVDANVGTKIASDLNQLLFQDYEQEIELAYSPLRDDGSDAATSPMILAAIGETSAPPKAPAFVVSSPVLSQSNGSNPPTVPKVSPLSPSPIPASAMLSSAPQAVPPPSPTLANAASSPTFRIIPPSVPQPKTAASLPPSPSAPPTPVPSRAEPPVVSPSTPLGTGRVEPSFSAKIEAIQAKERAVAGQTPLKPSPSLTPTPTPAIPSAPKPLAFSPAPPVSTPFPPKSDGPISSPLPMMMHENLSTQPIGKNPELRMDYSKQNTASNINAPRSQGVPP